MSDLGVKTEISNASEGKLKLGSDTYIGLLDLHVHIGRPEDRAPTTDAGALYTYGKGDNWMTFTLVATTPEIKSLIDFNILGTNGGLNNDGAELSYTIIVLDVKGDNATLTCTGVMRAIDLRKPQQGKWEIDCDVRITTDAVAVTVTQA